MIPIAKPWLTGNELKYLTECIETNWISSQGKFVKQFEADFARFCNKSYGIATPSGTTSLHLALKALGIQEGDEVIVPTLTFIASANSIRYCNAKPVFVDSEYESWGIDPKKIEKKITSKTKAIMVVHLFGHPADMDPIIETAKKHGLPVIEDAAEAPGAYYKDKIIGSFGVINSFSFFANKIITTGEGGMVVTNNKELAEHMNILRNHGMSTEQKYIHPYLGFNYRMTNLQAAVGLAQLEKIEENLQKREAIAVEYRKELKNIQGITLQPAERAKPVNWFFNILIEDDLKSKTSKSSRDVFIEQLWNKGVEARPFMHCIHKQPSYKEYNGESYPVAEDISRRGVNLPCYPSLTNSERDIVIKAIKEICNEAYELTCD